MPIYDFIADLGQLQENYKSYDEKQKKSYDDLKNSILKTQTDYASNKDINTINENDGVDNVPQAKKQAPQGMGMLGEIVNIFGSKKEEPVAQKTAQQTTANADNIISLTDDELNNPVSSYSNPELAPDTASKAAGAEGGAMAGILGTQGEGEAMAIAGFGMDSMKTLKTEAASDEEAMMNTASLTMKGTQAGMSVGGPWGAAIGGSIGLGVGVYDLFGDRGDRNERKRDAYNDMLEVGKTKREQEQRMKDGEESLAKLKELRKSQLNYINPNY